MLWSFKHPIHLLFHVHFINLLDPSLTHALSLNYLIAKYCYLFTTGEFIEELFEWVPFFVAIFNLVLLTLFLVPSTPGILFCFVSRMISGSCSGTIHSVVEPITPGTLFLLERAEMEYPGLHFASVKIHSIF